MNKKKKTKEISKDSLKESSVALRNAKELSQEIQTKRQANKKHFIKILELCQIEISKSLELGYTHCIFEVPEFLIGYPLYDINECIVYVLRKLKENDYHVNYYFPKTIYITWPIEETNDDKINNAFLDVLKGIQVKHTKTQNLINSDFYDQNIRKIETSKYYPVQDESELRFNAEQTQQFLDVFKMYMGENNDFYTKPSKNCLESEKLKQKIQSSFCPNYYLTSEKIQDIENWKENVKTVPGERTLMEKCTKVKNNDDIKKVMHNPFYLFDNDTSETLKQPDQSGQSGQSGQLGQSSLELKQHELDMNSKDKEIDHNNKTNRSEKSNLKNEETKKREKKKKEIKPLSDLKNKKKFVLDLSL